MDLKYLANLLDQYKKLGTQPNQPVPSQSPPPQGPNLDPNKVQQFQQGFRGYANGGIVDQAMQLAPLAMMFLNEGGEVERDPQSKQDMNDSSQEAQKDYSNAKKQHKKVMQDMGDEDIPEPEAPKKYSKGGKVRKYAGGTPDVQPSDQDDASEGMPAQVGKDLYTPEQQQAMQDSMSDDVSDQDLRSDNPASLDDVEDKDDASDSKAEDTQAFIDNLKSKQDSKGSDKVDPTKPADTSRIMDMIARLKPGQVPLSGNINPALGSASDLQKAQDQRRQILQSDQMLKGANMISAGLTKSNPLPDSFFDNSKLAALPVQQYQEQIANQQNDPNSPASATVRAYLQSKGLNVPDNASAADLFKIAPYLAKDQTLQYQLHKAELDNQNKGLQRFNASNIATNRDQAIKDAAQIRADAMSKGQGRTDDRSDRRLSSTVVSKINNDPVIKPSIQNIASLEKSQALLDDTSIPVTPQLFRDAQQDIASALRIRGMGGSEGQIKRSELETLSTKYADLLQKWGDDPNVDLRKVAPEAVTMVSNMNKKLHADYVDSVKTRKDSLAQEYQPMAEGSPRLQKTVDQYLKSDKMDKSFLQNAGNTPQQVPQGQSVIYDASGAQHSIPTKNVDKAVASGKYFSKPPNTQSGN